MPNPIPRKYTVQLGPSFTPDTAGELAAWAEVRGLSLSEVTRVCAERGLELLRADWAAEGGRLNPVKLAGHVEAAHVRGEKQAGRRARYDRSRGTKPADAPEAIDAESAA